MLHSSMKKIVFFLIVIFNFQFSFPQKSDSLQKVISKTSGNIKAEALRKLALLYIDKNDSLALNYINDGIKQIQNDKKLKGKLIFHKGMLQRSLKNDFLAIANLKKSVAILKNIDSAGTIDALYWLHRIYQRKGKFPQALQYGYKELEYSKALKDQNQIIKALLEIGYTYDRMGDYQEAIKWHRKGVKMANASNNKYYKAWGTGLIGIAYDELQQYDSALYYNKKAILLFKKINDTYFLRTWYSNIANTYTKLKNLKKAEEYILKSLTIDTNNIKKSIILINLGKIYIDTKRYKKAEKILDSAVVIAQRNDQKKFLSEAYMRLHELRKKQHRYNEALSYYINYKKTEDNLFNEKKAEQVAELKIQYNTTEKENEILTQRADLAEIDLTIQQRNFQMYSILGLAFILGLIGILFYNQQRLKNRQLLKENKLKDELATVQTQNKLQEQRLRISRDLHDNIGSQLTFIISSIDNLKFITKSADKNLKNKLSTINDFASNTINQLRDTIWAMNKNEISLADFYNRMLSFIEKAKHAKTDITFNVTNTIQSNSILSSVKGINIFRVIQEAVNNAIKYAKASKINVLIEESESNITFTVSDNGKGFDINTINFGNGLENMQKRIDEVGGTLSIDSHPSKGTTITVTCTKNTINAV